MARRPILTAEEVEERRVRNNVATLARYHQAMLDPAFRAMRRIRNRRYYAEHKADPDYHARSRQHKATYKEKFNIDVWRKAKCDYQRRYRATHREQYLAYQRSYQRQWQLRKKEREGRVTEDAEKTGRVPDTGFKK